MEEGTFKAFLVRELRLTHDSARSGRQSLPAASENVSNDGKPGEPATAGRTSMRIKELEDIDASLDLPRKEKKRSKSKSKRKRASSIRAVCKNCSDLCRLDNNDDGECVYHDGELPSDLPPGFRRR